MAPGRTKLIQLKDDFLDFLAGGNPPTPTASHLIAIPVDWLAHLVPWPVLDVEKCLLFKQKFTIIEI